MHSITQLSCSPFINSWHTFKNKHVKRLLNDIDYIQLKAFHVVYSSRTHIRTTQSNHPSTNPTKCIWNRRRDALRNHAMPFGLVLSERAAFTCICLHRVYVASSKKPIHKNFVLNLLLTFKAQFKAHTRFRNIYNAFELMFLLLFRSLFQISFEMKYSKDSHSTWQHNGDVKFNFKWSWNKYKIQ